MRRTCPFAFAPALAVVLLAGPAPADPGSPAPGAVDFNRDVRPILSNACVRCHGPDAGSREAGLRLDRRDDAMATLESGAAAVVPGRPDDSELIARIVEEDDGFRMPPRGAGPRLGPAQVAVLRRWIEQGAPWGEHWSLVTPRRPAVPEVRDTRWVRNPIDRFILARLEREGLAPSPEADRVTLARRLHFDLIGLPPAPEDVDAFAADDGAEAYERTVEALLRSPHHGERMAVPWLDLVRYADTVGYHSDVARSVSLYRDYVIRAFNENVPFDRFTVEQLAGDLLPGATAWQRVASAYNMLILTTEEGGAQPREYLARHAADRVRNLGSAWMGVTLGCAECHDHKYDPFAARDFYAFAAFFADIQQPGVGTPKPTLAVPTAAQAAELARLDAALAEWTERAKRPGEAPELIAARAALAAKVAEVSRARDRLDRQVRRTITTESGPPRVTRVLTRGDWMDETGEEVGPGVPRSLPPLPASGGRRPDRLDLARWLVSPDHPLTARAFVNRLWAQFFGSGLSDTLDDLGAQGEWPSHPELLDWLAVEFRESGWDVRHMVRLMVGSATYRQSSRPRADLATIDPRNRLYARQSSSRLPAEAIRDNALAVSGLLVREVGGESVRPYQPAGYWRFLNFPPREYTPSSGADQYRRGLYTHWQRTLLHPALLAFDAPSRELCTARRPISNTPQAALALLNDPTHVEAARHLAARALAEGGPDEASRLAWIWRRVLSRPAEPREAEILRVLLGKHRSEYAADPAAARALLAVGQSPPAPGDPAEVAAWTSVARALLNLDETITRD